MPQVLPPDIHHPDSSPGDRSTDGPENRVIELEVELFDDRSYVRESGWKGEGALVLSLWTQKGLVAPLQPNSRIQFCLSPDGAEALLEELQKVLEKK